MPFDQATYQIPDCQDILSETHNLLLHPHPCQKMTRTSCVGFFSLILEKPFPIKIAKVAFILQDKNFVHFLLLSDDRFVYFYAHLSPLGPERRIKLTMWKESRLQACEKLQQMASFWKTEWRPLDPILAHQHHSATTVH